MARSEARLPLKQVRVWLDVEIDMRHEDHTIAALEVEQLVKDALQGRGYRIHNIQVAGKTLRDEDKRWVARLQGQDREQRVARFTRLPQLQQSIVMHCSNVPRTVNEIFAPFRADHTTKDVAQAITELKFDGWLAVVEMGTSFEKAIRPETKEGMRQIAEASQASQITTSHSGPRSPVQDGQDGPRSTVIKKG